MTTKLLNEVTAVGVSDSIRVGDRVKDHVIDCLFNSVTTAEISALVLRLQGSQTNEDGKNGIITEPGLIVGSTTDNVANILFAYLIDGVSYTKAAVVAGAEMSEGLDGLSATVGDYKITLSKFGGFKVYIDSAGLLRFAFPALQQAYATVALANAAVEALPSSYVASALKYIEIGKVLIENDGTEWVAATDDMVAASDVTTVSFISLGSSFTDIATHTFTAAEIANARAIFNVMNVGSSFIRLYLSTLTGTGKVTARYGAIRR